MYSNISFPVLLYIVSLDAMILPCNFASKPAVVYLPSYICKIFILLKHAQDTINIISVVLGKKDNMIV